MIRLLVLPALLLAVTAAQAQDKVTVDSLLKSGFEVKAVMPSNAGPGLVLENGDKVFMCFVAEAPTSTDIATQYCKPVH